MTVAIFNAVCCEENRYLTASFGLLGTAISFLRLVNVFTHLSNNFVVGKNSPLASLVRCPFSKMKWQ